MELLILILFVLIITSIGKIERFSPTYIPEHQSKCYSKNINQCIKTPGCGLCVKDDFKCLPGDDHGPYFCKNCKWWVNTPQYFDNSLHDIKTNISRPYNWNYNFMVDMPERIAIGRLK